MKITHSLVVNIQDVTHIVQPKFNRFRATSNIHFILKLPVFSLDGFTNEILVTPVENIYFFKT